jgi:hypothetical protein
MSQKQKQTKMSEQLSTRIENKDQAHTAAIASEMARRVINTELSMGAPVGNPEERIATSEQEAEDGYWNSPSNNRDGENVVHDFQRNANAMLAARMENVNVSKYAGTLEIDEANGITEKVQRTVGGAIESIKTVMSATIRSADARNQAMTQGWKERNLVGPALVNINPANESPQEIAAFGTDPESMKSEELILEILGVDKEAIANALPTMKGIQRINGGREEGEFYIEHREVPTELEGIALEVRRWEGIPGARDETLTELIVKRSLDITESNSANV